MSESGDIREMREIVSYGQNKGKNHKKNCGFLCPFFMPFVPKTCCQKVSFDY